MAFGNCVSKMNTNFIQKEKRTRGAVGRWTPRERMGRKPQRGEFPAMQMMGEMA